ncbi:MliC family protein [Moraxella nasovis]|uniref:MliC family protein n=1 Tax=Moraxella nasovis TaxID=2904121 RepID=UPI001F61243D|nr:MliC family protein [Moraxella nasovis]UNU74239.1 MliC family protein [Moraxella nasovis]
MKFALPITAACVLALTGCTATDHIINKAQTVTQNAVQTVKNAVNDYQPHSKTFICENGMAPKIDYLNDSQINLNLEGRTTTLDAATAASGELYVAEKGIFGHGGEWHQKGDMATFSYSNLHGVAADINCKAE